MHRIVFVGVCTAALLNAAPIHADEQMHLLAHSGDWGALAHSPSMTATPDVCLAVNPVRGVAFRADGSDVEIRLSDKSWSLPVNVVGSISISVGTWKKSFEIDDNTANTVVVALPPDDIGPLFAAMDKAPIMTIAVGKARPMNVSLSGSAVATNAFRTCARIDSNAETPGGNPFK